MAKLSESAKQLLAYALERGGTSSLVFDLEVANEAIRAGLIELVALGVDDPLVVLTPAGSDYCMMRSRSGGALDHRIARAPS